MSITVTLLAKSMVQPGFMKEAALRGFEQPGTASIPPDPRTHVVAYSCDALTEFAKDTAGHVDSIAQSHAHFTFMFEGDVARAMNYVGPQYSVPGADVVIFTKSAADLRRQLPQFTDIRYNPKDIVELFTLVIAICKLNAPLTFGDL